MTQNTINILNEIANELVLLVKLVMESPETINVKTNTNTLKDSNIYKDIETKIDLNNEPIINLFLNYYIDYIERGREQFHRPMVPIDALRDWARRKLGNDDNSTLFAVQQSIFKFGIHARQIMPYVFNNFDDNWSSNADKLFNSIMEELDKYFKD